MIQAVIVMISIVNVDTIANIVKKFHKLKKERQIQKKKKNLKILKSCYK